MTKSLPKRRKCALRISKMKILAIESSCDETAAAVVENGRRVLSNTVASQIEIHRRFGGVVPEIASRNHTLAIENVVKQALDEANCTKDDIDAVAVTYGAGLLGALLVGVNYAKALAYAWGKPLYAISHVKGHIAANYIDSDLEPPYICLLASGGHTALLLVEDYEKLSFSDSPATTRRAKRSTKWLAFWDCRIQAAQKFRNLPKKEIPFTKCRVPFSKKTTRCISLTAD